MNDLTLQQENDRLQVRVRALSRSYSELSTVTNSIIDSLEKRLELSKSSPCECCQNRASSIDSLEFQVEQFKLERVDIKIAVKNLSLYLQIQAG